MHILHRVWRWGITLFLFDKVNISTEWIWYSSGCCQTVQRHWGGGLRWLPADWVHQSHGGAVGWDPAGAPQLPPALRGQQSVVGPAVLCSLQPWQASPPADSLEGGDGQQAEHPPHLLPPAEVHRPDHPPALPGLLGQHRPGPCL